MKKTILMIVLVCWAVAMVRAQKTCVIANAEDHVPVREALIHTDNNHWARTEAMWTETVDRDGYHGPRFVKVSEDDETVPDMHDSADFGL